MIAQTLSLLLAAVPSTPDLGTADARCRPDEPGPAILIELAGLKDRHGMVRAELYPDNDRDFLADDNALVAQHKVFRRIDMPTPQSGPVRLCLRVPQPGAYTLAILHDRDGDRKFEALRDGVGFPGNPRMGWSRPAAAAARIVVGTGITPTRIILNYQHGLLSFGPLRSAGER